MDNINLQLPYVGSFQNRSFTYLSENPLEEVWTRISQLGSSEFILFKSHPNHTNLNWNSIVQYSVIRIRQSVEFRNAFRYSTLLTSPLPLYYSFLNLTRSILAINSATIPSKGHGLTFQIGTDILTSTATLSKGTFIDYLNFMRISLKPNLSITLSDTLSRISEICNDYSLFRGPGQESLVVPITVDAKINGNVLLIFPDSLTNFRSTWNQEFPSLTGSTLEPTGNILKIHFQNHNYKSISIFCINKLETDLIRRDTPIWYLVRQVNPDFILPRPAYYFIALFILSSIVRYQPELMLETMNPDSQLGWLLCRLLKAAERFYPQLMLNWLYDRTIYF